ncbi:MAG TPA: transcriptional regulator [Armatimonadetes bacterium]|nr:transcriptional regulator [Armatimonadota bacterium]
MPSQSKEGIFLRRSLWRIGRRKELEERRAEFFAALACSTRIRILELLRDGEKCVTDIIPILRVKQSVVSRHLGVLRRVGAVEARREGTRVFYRLATPLVLQILNLADRMLERMEREPQEVPGPR